MWLQGHTTETRVINIPMPFLTKAIAQTKTLRVGGDISFGQTDLHKSALVAKVRTPASNLRRETFRLTSRHGSSVG
jgi:hypothetical protein